VLYSFADEVAKVWVLTPSSSTLQLKPNPSAIFPIDPQVHHHLLTDVAFAREHVIESVLSTERDGFSGRNGQQATFEYFGLPENLST